MVLLDASSTVSANSLKRLDEVPRVETKLVGRSAHGKPRCLRHQRHWSLQAYHWARFVEAWAGTGTWRPRSGGRPVQAVTALQRGSTIELRGATAVRTRRSGGVGESQLAGAR